MEMFPFLLLIFSLLFFSLYHIRRRQLQLQLQPLTTDIVPTVNTTKSNDSNPDSFLLEKKESEASGAGDHVECVKKKKKKRTKKKRSGVDEFSKNEVGIRNEKEEKELVCLYPFTSSSSATQRKIKQQYDQLVKSHDSNGLTLLQVGQFVNCLIEARDEIKHKSEVIHRKFTITKALLFKAGRSSFDRYRQQIYKLKLEQKRIEEDAFVYNWLQQQLKLSPAYKKMLEIGAYMDSKPKSDEATEDTDFDVSDISFEELLAQEKKDSFWQKKGKPRSGSD